MKSAAQQKSKHSNNILPVLIFFLLFLTFHTKSSGQFNESNKYVDSLFLSRDNTVLFGFDKLVNTINFKANANLNISSDIGLFTIKQFYYGSGIMSETNSFRDDESFSLKYSNPISKNISVIVKQNWLYAADTRDIGLSRLQRLNGKAGLLFNFINNDSYLEMTGGLEQNIQQGLNSSGNLMNLSFLIDKLEFKDFNFSSALNGEYLSLNNNRKNGDLDVLVSTIWQTDMTNNMAINLKYKFLSRDFINSNQYNTSGFYSIESRQEKRFSPDLGVNFSLIKNLSINMNLSLNDLYINRYFKSEVKDYDVSKVERNIHELQLFYYGEARYLSEIYNQTVGLSFFIRNETNSIRSRFDINPIIENNLRQIENQRDNISSNTRLNFRSLILPTKSDSIQLNINISLLQYDTPSNLNNDDRDMQNIFLGLTYAKVLNDNLSASVTGEYQVAHTVFLRAERSAINNFNRIFRLVPQISWQLRGFKYYPQFEVLANYTVYDFEDITPGIKSFSFRQLGYRDSIFIYLGNNLSLQSRITLRYFEKGILFWNIFSESPQSSYLENFAKLLLISELSENVMIGCGIRYYNLIQKNLKNSLLDDFTQNSIGLESVMRFEFDKGSWITIQGWYEFQNIKGSVKRQIPNLLMLTNIKI